MSRVLTTFAAAVLSVIVVACAPGGPSLDSASLNYHRFEGSAFDNVCQADEDCVVGGCGGEVCAAEPVTTSCELIDLPDLGQCSCYFGDCQWSK